MKHNVLIFFLITLLSFPIYRTASGQNGNNPPRLEPPSWWIGFKDPSVQLMVYGKDIALLKPEVSWPGVTITQYTALNNPNYLFVTLRIDPSTRPGTLEIQFFKGRRLITTRPFTLFPRDENSASRKGFNSADAIYLLMPDRFANSDPSNDNRPQMVEKANREAPYGRHGGDLKGIQEHLDYIASMGFTALCTMAQPCSGKQPARIVVSRICHHRLLPSGSTIGHQ